MNRKFVFLLLPFLIFTQAVFSQEPAQSVFFAHRGAESQWLAYQDNHRALYRIITDEAFNLLDARAKKVSKLNSPENWRNHQKEISTALCSSLAKFKKTPLNARTTGILERETFTVEKVLFESHPGFYVTAGLFIPRKRQKPAPAVIYACGHTSMGFRSETYQHVILNLVKKGFIVLAFDPIGQGERLQYPDAETGKSKMGGPTIEHSYAGVQTLLTGTSLTDYFIWDGIRVLDYLETRTEVDMNRVGMTGRSGGGTQTVQIAACDNRIYAAAPECYLTNFKRLLQSIGPQDAEQNPYNAIKKGFDHPDYLHIRAPKPTLMITTTHDFFSIQGVRETFAEVQKSYDAFGKPENIQMTEDMGVHESTKNNREALYTFFQKHLGLPGEPLDMETSPFSIEELWVTPTGQVSTSFDCETVFSLNRNYFPGKKPPDNLQKQVAKTAGIRFNRKLTAAVYTGKFKKNGIEVQKYFLENDRKDYALPVYVIQNEYSNPKKITVWFHPEGKAMLPDEPLLTELLDAGHTLVSADLPGTGELNDPTFSGDAVIQGIPFNYTFGANLAGKSIPGIQAEAIDLLIQFTKKQFPEKPTEAIVQGIAASAFLHYAVLKNPFYKITFREFPGPVEKLITKEYYNLAVAFTSAPGSLLQYDLPDLTEYLKTTGTKVIIQLNTDRY
jgi:cephalosporin-C deacetylase-like acetyl esterase